MYCVWSSGNTCVSLHCSTVQLYPKSGWHIIRVSAWLHYQSCWLAFCNQYLVRGYELLRSDRLAYSGMSLTNVCSWAEFTMWTHRKRCVTHCVQQTQTIAKHAPIWLLDGSCRWRWCRSLLCLTTWWSTVQQFKLFMAVVSDVAGDFLSDHDIMLYYVRSVRGVLPPIDDNPHHL